jgi:hypothetical protein
MHDPVERRFRPESSQTATLGLGSYQTTKSVCNHPSRSWILPAGELPRDFFNHEYDESHESGRSWTKIAWSESPAEPSRWAGDADDAGESRPNRELQRHTDDSVPHRRFGSVAALVFIGLADSLLQNLPVFI